MSGFSRCLILGSPGGYMGSDGPSEIDAIVLLGAGDTEYYFRLHPNCELGKIYHPNEPFNKNELRNALQNLLPRELLERWNMIGEFDPNEIFGLYFADIENLNKIKLK